MNDNNLYLTKQDEFLMNNFFIVASSLNALCVMSPVAQKSLSSCLVVAQQSLSLIFVKFATLCAVYETENRYSLVFSHILTCVEESMFPQFHPFYPS